MKMTPLSWCIVLSTVANLATAAMVGWFLTAKPPLRVIGGVSIYGGVRIEGETIDAKLDDEAILKVMLCQRTRELYNGPAFGGAGGSQFVPVTHCASIDPAESLGGIKSYGLSVVQVRQ